MLPRMRWGMWMRMRNLTDLAAAIDSVVERLAGLSEAEVGELEAMLERALTHVLVERHLRVRDSGVSHLRPVS